MIHNIVAVVTSLGLVNGTERFRRAHVPDGACRQSLCQEHDDLWQNQGAGRNCNNGYMYLTADGHDGVILEERSLGSVRCSRSC
jgi:hypothetical protein